MTTNRKLSRRSFLARVAGGAVVGGGAMVALAQTAGALQPVTDADNGPITDPGGNGRGRRIPRCTDNDSGSNADRSGQGRGNRQTDRDGGARADPVGCGRRR